MAKQTNNDGRLRNSKSREQSIEILTDGSATKTKDAGSALGASSPPKMRGIPGCEDREDRARRLNEKLRGLARTTLEVAIELGGILIGLKAEQRHGDWIPYVEDHLRIGNRSASNYMRLWKRSQEGGGLEELVKSELNTDSTITKVLELIRNEDDASQHDTSGNNGSDSENDDDSAPSEDDDETETVTFADGSRLSLPAYGWREGVIPSDRLIAWLGSTPRSTDQIKTKLAVRRQRLVVALATGLNRGVGDVPAPTALELLPDAVADLQQLLRSIGADQAG